MNLRKDHYRNGDLIVCVVLAIISASSLSFSVLDSCKFVVLKSCRPLKACMSELLAANASWLATLCRSCPVSWFFGIFFAWHVHCRVSMASSVFANIEDKRLWRVTGYLKVYKTMLTDRLLTHARSVGGIRRSRRAVAPRL